MNIPSDFEIIDPHIHQWDLLQTPRILSPFKKYLGWNNKLYETLVWLGAKKSDKDYVGRPDFVAHDYLPQDYRADVGNLPIHQVVHVEAEWQHKSGLGPAEETAWLEQLFSDTEPETGISLAACVGYVELEKPTATALIEAHQRASRRCVGVRQMLAFDPDKGIMRFCQTPELSTMVQWRQGFEALARYQLLFEAWFFHHQLHELDSLARDFPDVQFVLDHMGTPIGAGGPFASYGHTASQRDRIFKEWQEGMARVAENPNVMVKLSGFFMPVVGWGYHLRPQAPSVAEVAERFEPFFSEVIQLFGVDRCLFASNFPMDKVSLSLQALYEVYWRLCEGFDLDTKAKLFRGNAQKVYQLHQPVHGSKKLSMPET